MPKNGSMTIESRINLLMARYKAIHKQWPDRLRVSPDVYVEIQASRLYINDDPANSRGSIFGLDILVKKGNNRLAASSFVTLGESK